MKKHLALSIAGVLAVTLASHAEPVAGWVIFAGDAAFTGGSEATASPSVAGLPADTIAASFPAVNLADKESIVLNGSVTFAGSAGGNQFRIGLFNGPSPVVTAQGSGYAGINADAPSSGTGAVKFGNGTASNPFTSAASTAIAPMSNPGGAAPGGIPIHFSLRITRDGDNLDIEANLNNVAGGGTWTSTSGVVQDYASPGGFSFNTAAFLMGASVGGTTAHYTNIDVSLVQFDADRDGMSDAWELANGLSVGVDDSGEDPDKDGLNHFQEYLGHDGMAASGDETNPQIADTDGDGLKDGAEITAGINPLNPDSDGDFFLDGDEVATSTSPMDPQSFPIPSVGLFIDFSSETGGGQVGPYHDPAYLPFVANHEIDASNAGAGDLIVDRSQSFPVPAFPGHPTVTLTVAYPDLLSGDPRVKQLIGRGDAPGAGGGALLYQGEHRKLLRDWIGIDPRAGSGGNGLGVPTSMTFTFTGIPAGVYQYRGYHHDTANIQAPFQLYITDASRTAAPIGTFRMTHSNPSGLSPAGDPGAGNPPSALPSTIEFLFISSGNDPVVVTYSAEERTAFQNSMVGVNGIEITVAVDTDGDGIPDAADLRPAVDDTGLSSDADTLTDQGEYHLGTKLDDPDTDHDGFNDDVESNTGVWVSTADTGTSPFAPDWDADGLLDGLESFDWNFGNWPVTAGTDPFDPDTDDDSHLDGEEAYAGYDPTNPGSFPPLPPLKVRLVSVDMVAGAVTIEWNSLDNGTATYAIHASETPLGNLQSDWALVANVTTAGTVTTYTETLPLPAPKMRFYVVVQNP